jgi:hypothetical protein
VLAVENLLTRTNIAPSHDVWNADVLDCPLRSND